MNALKKGRFEEIIRHLAGRFFALESSGLSMITVTKVVSSDAGDKVTIYLTVYPESRQRAALDFAKRNRSDFRAFVKGNSRLANIPFFDFEIDLGERARQKIDALAL